MRREAQTAPQDAFKVDAYLIEAVLPRSSPFVNRPVAELEALAEGEVSVIAIIRDGRHRYVPAGHWWMFADDVLMLQGDAHGLRELTEEAGLDVVGTTKPPDEAVRPPISALLKQSSWQGRRSLATRPLNCVCGTGSASTLSP